LVSEVCIVAEKQPTRRNSLKVSTLNLYTWTFK
jgi:hypothetical protein